MAAPNYHPPCEHRCEHAHHRRPHHWLKGIIGIAWGVALLILSLLNLDIPLIAQYCITAATGLATLFLGYQTYVAAIKEFIQSKKLTMSALYMISTLTILVISVLHFFVPGLPEIAEAAPLILGIWHLGEAIEHSLTGKIVSRLSIRDDAPKTITKIERGSSHENFPVEQLQPGDVISIQLGQVIPVDGFCLEPTQLSTKDINGAITPELYQPNRPFLAGVRSKNAHPINIQVTNTFANSNLSLIHNLINETGKRKAPIEEFTSKVLKYFVPTLLITAVISSVLIGVFFNDTALAIQCAIAVLVSACPCTLSLITPLAVKISMSKAAKRGIYFKNGEKLQAAEKIDKVVFDLNNTFTLQEVSSIEKYDDHILQAQLLQDIATLESKVDHPIAKAICRYTSKHGIENRAQEDIEVNTSNHWGVSATINGKNLSIGHPNMFRDLGIALPESHDTENCIYVAQNESIIGKIFLQEKLRPGAKETVEKLKSMGKEVFICTGTDTETAKKYATLLNISDKNVKAKCDAAEKATYIEALKEKGKKKIAMVGDAVNDAPAMTASDLGIAIESNSKLIYKTASVIIQNESLISVVTTLEVAKKTTPIIYQNLGISLFYNSCVTLVAAGLFVALGLHLDPVIGIALMVVETVVVLANIFRFKLQNLPIYNTTSWEEQSLTYHHLLKKLSDSTKGLSSTCATLVADTRQEPPTSAKNLPLIHTILPSHRKQDYTQRPDFFYETFHTGFGVTNTNSAAPMPL